MAAAEMRASATMRSSDAVLVTVVGETSDGREYATAMVARQGLLAAPYMCVAAPPTWMSMKREGE